MQRKPGRPPFQKTLLFEARKRAKVPAPLIRAAVT